MRVCRCCGSGHYEETLELGYEKNNRLALAKLLTKRVPLHQEAESNTGASRVTVKRSRSGPAPLGLAGWANRGWRLFVTGLSFLTFGLGGLILGVLVFPLCFVLIGNRLKRQWVARQIIGGSFGAFVWMMKSLGVLSYEIRGAGNWHNLQGTLIIANHPSLIDVVFLVSFFPQAECVVKNAVIRNPFMRGTVTAANYVSNSDPEEILANCTQRLNQGSNLILFPEGTRRDQSEPFRFKLGAAAIAVRSQASILPIYIECRPATLRKHEPWYRIPRHRPHWVFEIPPPLKVEELTAGESHPRFATRKLQQALVRYYELRRANYLDTGSSTDGKEAGVKAL